MLKLKKLIYAARFSIIFAFIAVVLTFVFWSLVPSGKFLFMGDQFFRFNWHEAYINSFFLRKWENLGVFNSWQLMVQFWDVLFYLVVYGLGFSLVSAEKILFIVFLLIQLNVSFYGFRKLRDLFKINSDDWVVFVATLFFCFNPYGIVVWHGGLAFLGLAITYSLTPWIIYYLHRSLFVTGSIRDILLASIVMFLSSFVFWLYAVVVFITGIYLVSYYVIRRPNIIVVLKRFTTVIISYLILSLPIIFTITLEYFNNSADMNGQFAGMYNMQKGGLWYQFLMYFSWGIYNIWTPRSLYPFSDYFYSPLYIASTIGIYVLALLGTVSLYKHKKNRLVIGIFFAILCLSIFFAKGSQPPLGSLFVFMYNHVPFFNVFRSPDHRFGFSVIFTLTVLLIISGSRLKKKIFIPLLLILIVAQSNLLLSGKALVGENVVNKFFDRIVEIPDDYKTLASFINHDDGKFGYVLTIPQTEYGYYKLGDNEQHIGQDMLSKIIEKPFIYLSPSLGINRRAAVEIYTYVVKGMYDRLSNFPIKYILVRHDVVCTSECLSADETLISKSAYKVFENKSFTLYRLNNYADLIQGVGTTYKIDNPVSYEVTVHNAEVGKPMYVNFGMSLNNDWVIIPPMGEIKNTDTNITYSNLWTIVPTQRDFTFHIYYNPSSMFVITGILSLSYLVTCFYLIKKVRYSIN